MRIYDTMPYLQKPRIGSGGENNFKTISSKQPSRALLCLQRHNNRLYCDRPIRSSILLANMKSTNKQSSINSVVEASKTTYRLAKHSETFSNIRSDIEEVKSMLGRGVFCFSENAIAVNVPLVLEKQHTRARLQSSNHSKKSYLPQSQDSVNQVLNGIEKVRVDGRKGVFAISSSRSRIACR